MTSKRYQHAPKTLFGGRARLPHAARRKLTQKYLLQPNDDPAVGPPRMAHLTASEYRDLYTSRPSNSRVFQVWLCSQPMDTLVLSTAADHESMCRSGHGCWSNFQPGFDDMWRHVMPQSSILRTRRTCRSRFRGPFRDAGSGFPNVIEQLDAGLLRCAGLTARRSWHHRNGCTRPVRGCGASRRRRCGRPSNRCRHVGRTFTTWTREPLSLASTPRTSRGSDTASSS